MRCICFQLLFCPLEKSGRADLSFYIFILHFSHPSHLYCKLYTSHCELYFTVAQITLKLLEENVCCGVTGEQCCNHSVLYYSITIYSSSKLDSFHKQEKVQQRMIQRQSSVYFFKLLCDLFSCYGNSFDM